MIAGASFGVLGLVVLVAAWSRFAPNRSQRRSVQSHQHALGVLGEVAKRRDGVAQVHVPSPNEMARPHVRTTDGCPPPFHLASREEIRSRRPGVRLVLRSEPTPLRLPIFGDPEEVAPGEIPYRFGVPTESDSLVHFEDTDLGADAIDVAALSLNETSPVDSGWTEAQLPIRLAEATVESSDLAAQSDGSLDGDAAPPVSPVLLQRSHGDRRAARRGASVAAALIALAAIAVGSWQVASNHSAAPPVASHLPKVTHPHSLGTRQVASAGHEITPTSNLHSVVTYPLSSSSYTISFTSSQRCWIGVRQGVNGAYLWMTTLSAGTTGSYRANGPVYVRIGAPQYLRVKVDGVQLVLPPKVVQPYDITFAIGGPVSA